jgi:hypothetical protein
MAEMRFTDISNLPEVRRLAEEVRKTKEPRVLKTGNEAIAELRPISPTRRRKARVKTEADRKAFLSSAGGWKGLIDADKFLEDIYESRKVPRPKVD